MNTVGGGGGGGATFSSIFIPARATTSGGAHSHTIDVGDTTLTLGQIPPHGHDVLLDHKDFTGAPAEAGMQRVGNDGNASRTLLWPTKNAGGGGSHTHSGSSSNTGTHSHTVNLQVNYQDVIVCKKD